MGSERMGERAGTEGARRATGVPAHRAAEDRGRWSSRNKAEVVLRILRGEDLDSLSRELKVTAATLSEWRDTFLAAGQAGLKSRSGDFREEEIARLRAKVGELTMTKELLEAFVERVDPAHRPVMRRSSR
jgi:hypothetical protein